MASTPPLQGLRIVEASSLGPAALTMPLVDLGAEVIKVEPPQGDYIREMTWPIVEGVSLMHLHINRGKRSVRLDLRTDAGVAAFRDLAAGADAVVEAMRPGGLARRGLGFEQLREVNPRIVFCTISGYGMTGPYKDYPSHGVAYDTWAGIVSPATSPDGFAYLPEHASMGIHAGPLFGALGLLAGVLRARATGEGSFLEIAQSDAAAAMDWYRSESYRAYERPEDEVTGNKADGYERRPPGTKGMIEGVRYQVYEAGDGRYVLFMASEQAFWRNFCEGVGRMDLFERWPGSTYADHARNNTELQRQLKAIFATRTSSEWLDFGGAHNTPIAPVNTPETLLEDPQFKDRFELFPAADLGADQLPTPLKIHRRGAPGALPRAHRGPAHRRGAQRGARVGRRPDRRGRRRGGVRDRRRRGVSLRAPRRCRDRARRSRQPEMSSSDGASAGSVRSRNKSNAPTRKPSAPTKVPRLDSSSFHSWPVPGTMKAATAETPNATEPPRLTAVIHQSVRRGRQANHPWQTSHQANPLATRKQTEPRKSGRHTSWLAAWLLRTWRQALPVLQLKKRVPRSWTAVAHQSMRCGWRTNTLRRGCPGIGGTASTASQYCRKPAVVKKREPTKKVTESAVTPAAEA